VLKIAMFLGVCVAIYAIFSYLEARLIKNIDIDVTVAYLEKNEDEIMPQIIEDVVRNLTDMFKEHIDDLAKLGMLSAIKELAEVGVEVDGEKEEISETGEKNNKEFTRD
jgi:hypothetical protein